MESSTAWSLESREAMAAVAASVAALAVFTGSGAENADPSGSSSIGDAESDTLRDADPLRELADACLGGLAELARRDARSAALKVRFTADYAEAARALASPGASPHDRAVHEMALVAEVAGVLTVSEHAAGALLGESQALTTVLPLTLGALQAGTISWAHARIMVEETSNLDPAGAAALEAHFLDPDAPNPARGCPAGELVPGRFRAKARAWRERHHPVSIEKRHTRCAADRRVEYVPDRDGMAWLSAYLPADTAAGIWERTTAAARALQGPDEPRTLTQLRADVAATLLLTTGTGTGAGTDADADADADDNGGCGGVPVPRAQVLVTVPVLSLLGATDEPAVLGGYGPIPPSMARRLVADGAGSFYRVLTDPRDGAPLEIGRTSYRLTKAMRHWLRLRDGRCPFPGCNNPSLDNEADHVLAWADGGTTGISNLGQPCRKHHRLKHGSGWTPSGASKDKPPGWTSPSGRHYPSEQQDWEPPDCPDHLLRTDKDLDLDPPPDPGPDPALDLPADPFPDWYLFPAGHQIPAAETDWREPDEGSCLETFLIHSA
ncbi:DUF222 domain-containing protein [Arthrobacter sp. UYEF36]|uniref:HNH endonuclease signature motif containing protein n=1 Tax=Arthrobacter sp. UYEF36 TaxID=1756366 RepID=UPI0033992AA7